ncbi:uncharacterized protein [Agelaius tricolor]|uniref:uncharacterized protein isoform X2 n=1 Tax=Agelaius tricolor TaxID=9191 RepID=UPI0039F1C437
MRRRGRMETAAPKGWGRPSSSPLLPRGGALGNPSSLGRAFGSRHVPSAQEQQDLCCSQQDRKNHLTDPIFAQSFGVGAAKPNGLQLHWRVPAPARGVGCWNCLCGCALSPRCRELPGLNGAPPLFPGPLAEFPGIPWAPPLGSAPADALSSEGGAGHAPGPAGAAPVPRGGHLSLQELSSFQSLGSGLRELFSLRKGMHIPACRAPALWPTCASFPALLQCQLAPEKLQTSSKQNFI